MSIFSNGMNLLFQKRHDQFELVSSYIKTVSNIIGIDIIFIAIKTKDNKYLYCGYNGAKPPLSVSLSSKRLLKDRFEDIDSWPELSIPLEAQKPEGLIKKPFFSFNIKSQFDCDIVFLGYITESQYNKLNTNPVKIQEVNDEIKTFLFFLFSLTERNYFLRRIEQLKMQSGYALGRKLQGGIIVYDNQNNIICINQKAKILLGFENSDIERQNFSHLLSNSENEDVKKFIGILSDHSNRNKNIHQLINNQLYLISTTAIENSENVIVANITIILDAFEDFNYLRYIAHDYQHEIEFVKTDILMQIEKLTENIHEKKKNQVLGYMESIFEYLFIQAANITLFSLISGGWNVQPCNTPITDVKQLVFKICKRLEPYASSAGVKIDTSAKDIDDSYFLDVDMMSMDHVFKNILHNAVKFTSHNFDEHNVPDEYSIKFPIKVSIECNKDSKQMIIEFSDFGGGVSKANKTKIFNRGFKHGKNAGAGLGLYITHTIITNPAHGGQIKIKDADKKTLAGYTLSGSTFNISLPCFKKGDVQ